MKGDKYYTGAAKSLVVGKNQKGENAMNTEQEVIEIVSEQFSVDKGRIFMSSNFDNDLGADSLDAVELIIKFEEKFNIEIDDNQAEKIETVQDAIDCVESLI